MNYLGMQQNALAACEEMRGSVAKHPVICPKPRRFGPFPVRPLRRLPSYQLDLSDRCDSEAGVVDELFGIFLQKGGGEDDRVASSPSSFFCGGSPPSRVANPVVLDTCFGEDRPPVPISYLPPIQSGSPMPARIGCTPAKFGYEPAAVRVEGFNCLNGDRRSCSSVAVVA
ncbi:hypothetical protein Cni_G27267 [Canna indica]|uniref:Uncharacterized protein n=1 Tax=Canna indica TaxID=4628 RepID=A0AAQ3QMT7_9LILI|nr:hypothetical protein Cni_G27267 [Canna indica]